MKQETKRRINTALTTASEYIKSMRDVGIAEEDYSNFGEDNDDGMREFYKACDKASLLINKIAEKYRTN